MLVDWCRVNMIAEELAASSFVVQVVQGDCLDSLDDDDRGSRFFSNICNCIQLYMA
jgi:hypothetical protein